MNARAIVALALVAACSKSEDINKQPAFVAGTPVTRTCDGTTNDLPTGGVGKSGLGSNTAPGFADPNNPTAAELRTRAIYVNYRALVDFTEKAGTAPSGVPTSTRTAPSPPAKARSPATRRSPSPTTAPASRTSP